MTRLILPYPPSANRYWRNLRNGLVLVSKEAKDYKERVGWICIAAGIEPHCDDVRVSIDVYRPARRGDLDNVAKILLDALAGQAYTNDKQIVDLHLRRFDDKDNPRVEVEIQAVRMFENEGHLAIGAVRS